jgi:phage tail sheath protein FI
LEDFRMSDPVIGFAVRREALEPAPPSNARMSVIGLCKPAVKAANVTQDAFDTAFPLNQPVFFASASAKARMIDPDSSLGRDLTLINAQLARLQSAAQIVFVRVEQGANEAATIANIVGNAAARTGIHAFLKAGAAVGAIPRLIGSPGFTHQRTPGVDAISVTTPGSGYTSAPTITFTGGGTNPAKVLPTAHAVLGTGADDGKVMSIVIDTAGANLTAAPTIAFTGGAGTGAAATATIADVANPIAAALPAILNALYAVAVVDSDGADRDEDVEARETLQSDRILVVTPSVEMMDGAGATVTHSLSAAAFGLFVRRDFENEGRPFKSIMNQPVYGILGPSRAIEFSLTDGASEGQDLLAHQIGPLVRGESGDDFAIAEGGFVFLGFEGTGEETIWRQIHKVRGRDFIELTAIRTLRQYLGRWNLTTQTIQAVVNTVSAILEKAAARQEILGFTCRFDPAENNSADLRTGHIFIDARFEDVPVFRRATLISRPYQPALQATIDQLISAQTLIG